jgi:hypothetical protein
VEFSFFYPMIKSISIPSPAGTTSWITSGVAQLEMNWLGRRRFAETSRRLVGNLNCTPLDFNFCPPTGSSQLSPTRLTEKFWRNIAYLRLIGDYRRLKPTVNKISSLAGLELTYYQKTQIPLKYSLTRCSLILGDNGGFDGHPDSVFPFWVFISGAKVSLHTGFIGVKIYEFFFSSGKTVRVKR